MRGTTNLLVLLALALAVPRSASALTAGEPENRVRGFEPAPSHCSRANLHPTVELHWGKRDASTAVASGLRRWVSPDPLFLSSPDKAVGSPLELSLYSYAANNPMVFVDPSGLGREEVEAALRGDYSGFTPFTASAVDLNAVCAGVAASGQGAKPLAKGAAIVGTLGVGAAAAPALTANTITAGGTSVAGAANTATVAAGGVVARVGQTLQNTWNRVQGWVEGLFARAPDAPRIVDFSRALRAEDLGLRYGTQLEQLKGTINLAGNTLRVRVDMIKAVEGAKINPFSAVRTVVESAKGVGANVVRFEGSFANERLLDALSKRYDVVSQGANEFFEIIAK